ncbi:MAG: trypsin-like peptidase domain-containing protein [Trebonia sp.]
MPDTDISAADGKGNEPEPDAVTAVNAGAHPGRWGKRSVWVAASVAAALLAAGTAVGVTTAMRGSVSAAARIPSPPAKNAVFVEDDNGAGQDQQDNVLQYSAPGVVSIRSARGTVLGSGFVITRSGFVLATYRGLQGAGTLTARLVMSGKTYGARLVGSDQEANVALLQLSGTGFTPVAIGTAAGLNLDDRVASGGGTWTAKGVLLSTGAITGIDVPVTLDGNRLTGLLADSALAVPGSELGGPLFNLSGQVVGLSIGYGSGAGYAVPIDSALQLARQLAGQ